MTLEEAKALARELLNTKSATYIPLTYMRHAQELATYVLGLIPGQNIIEIDDEAVPDTLPPEPYETSPSVMPSPVRSSPPVPIDKPVSAAGRTRPRDTAPRNVLPVCPSEASEMAYVRTLGRRSTARTHYNRFLLIPRIRR
jgi:hypothetical protein